MQDKTRFRMDTLLKIHLTLCQSEMQRSEIELWLNCNDLSLLIQTWVQELNKYCITYINSVDGQIKPIP